MSRIGKKPVPVPTGVTANVEGQTVKVKGPKGELKLVLADDVAAKVEDGAIAVDPRDETKRARAMWGMSRTMVANLDDRRHQGLRAQARDHRRRLSRGGAGQEPAARSSATATMSIYPIPEGITIATPKPTEIVDHRHRQAEGRPGRRRDPRFRPPEPYKGKGVKYADEHIFRKEGKKK